MAESALKNEKPVLEVDMRLLLLEKRLEGFCEEPFQPEPTLSGPGRRQSALEKAQHSFATRQKKAWATVCFNVDADQQVNVVETMTAVREGMSNVYDAKSVYRLVRLQRRFSAATMAERADLLEHVTPMSQLAKHHKLLLLLKIYSICGRYGVNYQIS